MNLVQRSLPHLSRMVDNQIRPIYCYKSENFNEENAKRQIGSTGFWQFRVGAHTGRKSRQQLTDRRKTYIKFLGITTTAISAAQQPLRFITHCISCSQVPNDNISRLAPSFSLMLLQWSLQTSPCPPSPSWCRRLWLPASLASLLLI